jgi:hypothetical protein
VSSLFALNIHIDTSSGDGYNNSMNTKDKPTEKRHKVVITIRLDADLHDQLTERAALEERTQIWLIERALSQYFATTEAVPV